MSSLRCLLSLLLLVVLASARAQDTLPRFSVKNLGNDAQGNARVVIGWVNNYDSLRQISIQTSHDSLKNYRTLISLTDPNARFNGYADSKALNDHMFYRLFIVKSDGQYFFTRPQKPVLDTARTLPVNAVVRETPVVKKPAEVVVKKPDFVPSFYVYTNKDGYVYINLPDAERQRYRIRFLDESQGLLFEIKNIRQAGLTLDKINFLHGGWFHFELYNDEKLVEKNKVYLAKEF